MDRVPLAGAAVRLATTVTVATEWMRAHVAADGVVADEVIPLGADTRIFHPPPGRAPDPRNLVHVGSLNRVKDQDLLVRAMAELRALGVDAELTIVGGDTMNGYHARLASDLGVDDRITFTGQLPPVEVANRSVGAAWHVLTSRHDAGPVAVLEAAACGVPTIGVRVGHVADLRSDVAPAAVPIDERTPAAAARRIAAGATGTRPGIADRAERWARTHDPMPRRAPSRRSTAGWRPTADGRRPRRDRALAAGGRSGGRAGPAPTPRRGVAFGRQRGVPEAPPGDRRLDRSQGEHRRDPTAPRPTRGGDLLSPPAARCASLRCSSDGCGTAARRAVRETLRRRGRIIIRHG